MLSPDNIRANIAREYNILQDELCAFHDGFRDDPRILRIATTITEALTHKLLTVSPRHRTHPFVLYGDPGASPDTLLHALFRTVGPKFEDRYTRSLVVSFFHAGGTNRADLDELMDIFWAFQDTCMGLRDPNEDAEDEDDVAGSANPNASR